MDENNKNKNIVEFDLILNVCGIELNVISLKKLKKNITSS